MDRDQKPATVADCVTHLSAVLRCIDGLAADPDTLPPEKVTLAANYVQHALELMREP